MGERLDNFTIDHVLEVVSVELRFSREDLVVSVVGYDRPGSEVVRRMVSSRTTPFKVWVSRDRAAAEAACCAMVEKWLATGIFLDNMKVGPELFDAVAGICHLPGLVHWLTARVRQDWVISPEQPGRQSSDLVDPFLTIEDLKVNRAARLTELLRDPAASVVKLCRGDLDDSFAVLVEQCSFNTQALLAAIVRACGGREGLVLGGVSATTDEGIIIEPENDYTAEYMLALHDALRS